MHNVSQKERLSDPSFWLGLVSGYGEHTFYIHHGLQFLSSVGEIVRNVGAGSACLHVYDFDVVFIFILNRLSSTVTVNRCAGTHSHSLDASLMGDVSS